MTRLRLFLLLISSQLFTVSSFSTQLSVPPALWLRIQNQMGGSLQCLDIPAPSGSNLSRSRGLTRGAAPSQPILKTAPSSPLPASVEAFNQMFSNVIQVEFRVPFGFDHDPHAHAFLMRDPYEGAAKLRLYNEMGYRWAEAGSPTASPNWVQLALNYQMALKSRNLKPWENWIPTIVLYKLKSSQYDQTTAQTIKKFEYLFIDPLTESFPKDMSEWQVLTREVQFNIPFDAIFEAQKQRKLPMLNSKHEIDHFIAGIRFPELTKTILETIQKVERKDVTLGFKRRHYWLMESLSLPDPDGFESNQAFLRSMGRPLKARGLDAIEKELNQLSETQLLEYALKQARYFESQLRDVSGGNSNSAEKWYYISEVVGMMAEDSLALAADPISSHPVNEPDWRKVTLLAKTYFENGLVMLNANAKKMTNETVTFNFNSFIMGQRLLALYLQKHKKFTVRNTLPGVDRKQAMQYLLKYMSRTEMLLNQKPFTFEQWAEKFLQADLPLSDPLAQMLVDVFGNDIVRNIYLGVGTRRGE